MCEKQTVIVIGLLLSVALMLYSIDGFARCRYEAGSRDRCADEFVPGFVVTLIGVVYCSAIACRCCENTERHTYPPSSRAVSHQSSRTVRRSD
jgi:hypothetical protein